MQSFKSKSLISFKLDHPLTNFQRPIPYFTRVDRSPNIIWTIKIKFQRPGNLLDFRRCYHLTQAPKRKGGMFWRSTTRLKEQINRITELHDFLFFNFLVILKYYLYITRADCSSECTISPSMRAYLFLAPYGSSLGQITKRDLFKMALSQRVGGSIPAFQDKPVWEGQELGHF